jgi:hypothetical protein
MAIPIPTPISGRTAESGKSKSRGLFSQKSADNTGMLTACGGVEGRHGKNKKVTQAKASMEEQGEN